MRPALPALITIAFLALSCGRSDDSIAEDVRSRLIVDNTTTRLEVPVTVDGGVVRLAGVALTQRAYERALEIAHEVAESVVDELLLDEHPLTTAVRVAVQRDPLVAGVPVEIEAFDGGIVFLRSAQTTLEQRQRLAALAARVPGVADVTDLMK